MKRKMGNRKPSGFAKPGPVSDELCLFMNKEKGTHMARTEVTNTLYPKYIKDKSLVNNDNKKIIVPNPELKSLLAVRKLMKLLISSSASYESSFCFSKSLRGVCICCYFAFAVIFLFCHFYLK